MIRAIGRRLDRLAAIYGMKGCPRCQSWGTTTVEIVPANLTPIAFDRPDRCPACGRWAPRTTGLIQIVAPDDEDAGVLT
ncbi:MAG: hypothetical protein H0W06_03285 [Chloroflexia bacterium]|nr:hypothetical protein [Chloroflexia bacterium]